MLASEANTEKTGSIFMLCKSRNPHECRRLLRKVTPKVTPAIEPKHKGLRYAPADRKSAEEKGGFWCHYWCHFVLKFGAFWCDLVRGENASQLIDNKTFVPLCAALCKRVQKGGFLDSKSAEGNLVGVRPPSRHQDSKNFTCKVASPEREAVFIGGCFTCYLACNEVQRVAFPGFTERSRGRIGVKAAHSTPRYAVTEP